MQQKVDTEEEDDDNDDERSRSKSVDKEKPLEQLQHSSCAENSVKM